MKIQRLLTHLGLILIGIFMSFCTKDTDFEEAESQFINLDFPANISNRLVVVNQSIPLRRIKDGSSLPEEEYIFTQKYILGGPVVNNTSVQASHIKYWNNNVYITYNTAGSVTNGGFDIINFQNINNPIIYATGIEGSEYSSIEIITDTGSGESQMILAGSSETSGGNDISIVQIFDMDITGLPILDPIKIDLNGYTATDINFLGVVTGTSGGFYQLNLGSQNNANYITDLDDVRSIAYNNKNGEYVALLGKPGRLVTGLPGSSSIIPLGGISFPGTKAIVRINNGFAYAALGDGGLKVVDLATGMVTTSLERPEIPTGENQNNYVTNGVSVNQNAYVFIANGAAGIYVAKLIGDGSLETLGYLDMNASVNYVEANGDLLFAACGEKGVAIIQLSGLSDGVPTVSTTSINSVNISENTATSGGNIITNNNMNIQARGVCWSISQNPTIHDNKTVNGSGPGGFSSILTGLSPNTTYYVRAYANTTSGTFYGNEVGFTTLDAGAGSQTFIDSRDGNTYKWIQLGNQIWMAQNLAWLPEVSPSGSGSLVGPYYYVYDYNGFDVENAKSLYNYDKYGVLYNWEAATNACPTGWHLPTDEEWIILEETLGMDPQDAIKDRFRYSGDVGKKLRSQGGWFNNEYNNLNTGFDAFPAGYRNRGGSYKYIGNYTAFWTQSQNEFYAMYRGLYYFNDGVYRDYFYKSGGFSVRCIKN